MTNIGDKNNRDKEVKLLHLDHLQREALEAITTKFASGVKISISEVVEALTKYVIKLATTSSQEGKHLYDLNGMLTPSAQNYFKKFTDAILICSKYALNYNKILSLEDVRHSFEKASQPFNRLTAHHMNELEYRVKIAAYSMLEADNTKVMNYLDNIKDFYLRSLVTVNPQIAKRSFIDEIVTMLAHCGNRTISDISDIANKYAIYLGKSPIDHSRIEELVHKYSDVSHRLHEGLLHAAKIEVFQMLEGI